MTADGFRAIALSLPDTVESSHMNHPDFRIGGKIFATLGYPSCEWGALCLPPEEQARLVSAEPDVFVPAKGAWGRAGATQVFLPLARKTSVRAALRSAWKHRLQKHTSATVKKLGRKSGTARSRSLTTQNDG
jgi:hypothetical protein